MRGTRRLRMSAIATTALGTTLALLAGPASAPVHAGVADTDAATLVREPQQRPETLGGGPGGGMDGLQYADPAEGLDLVDPPQAGVHADRADREVPAGADPTAAAGRWGVPRYLPDKESETYLLDGRVLSPTAVRSTLRDRVAERQDFTRRHPDEPGTLTSPATPRV